MGGPRHQNNWHGKMNLVHDDGSIRPLADQNLCVQKVGLNFTNWQALYISTCEIDYATGKIAPSMRWTYNDKTGQIKWAPSVGAGTIDPNSSPSGARGNLDEVKREICWWVKNKARFTQLRLRTCRTSDSFQQFKYDNGMVKLRRTDKFKSCIQASPYGKTRADV